jgi:hypothetical protein
MPVITVLVGYRLRRERRSTERKVLSDTRDKSIIEDLALTSRLWSDRVPHIMCECVYDRMRRIVCRQMTGRVKGTRRMA